MQIILSTIYAPAIDNPNHIFLIAYYVHSTYNIRGLLKKAQLLDRVLNAFKRSCQKQQLADYLFNRAITVSDKRCNDDLITIGNRIRLKRIKCNIWNNPKNALVSKQIGSNC